MKQQLVEGLSHPQLVKYSNLETKNPAQKILQISERNVGMCGLACVSPWNPCRRGCWCVVGGVSTRDTFMDPCGSVRLSSFLSVEQRSGQPDGGGDRESDLYQS